MFSFPPSRRPFYAVVTKDSPGRKGFSAFLPLRCFLPSQIFTLPLRRESGGRPLGTTSCIFSFAFEPLASLPFLLIPGTCGSFPEACQCRAFFRAPFPGFFCSPFFSAAWKYYFCKDMADWFRSIPLSFDFSLHPPSSEFPICYQVVV